ncbi:MAG: helix-turn-helix domain-containing protein [Janthinobacterium lividum]
MGDEVVKLWAGIFRARRKALGISQKQVAALAGKAQSQIARIESGNEDPRLSSVIQVSRSLGIELIAVPIPLLSAVRHLLNQHTQGNVPNPPSRFVGNDPEDVEEESEV